MSQLKLGTIATIVMFASAPQVASGQATADSTFRWSGTVSEGARIVVRNMSGTVRVQAGTGDTVAVRAIKASRSGMLKTVDVAVSRYGPEGRDLVICARWQKETLVCDENSQVVNNEGNDTRVELVVTVPRGAHVTAENINGSLDITGVAGEVRANTVNGPMVVAVPANTNADLVVYSLNGTFESDFPITMEKGGRRRSFRSKLGSGGKRLQLSTVNGRMKLMRQDS
jgi:hypothetical protein